MKRTRLSILFLIILFLIASGAAALRPVAAATPTPTETAEATPTPASQEEEKAQIEELKERLATKVAELRTLVKRAMYGTVKSVSVASATVETSTKDIKIELSDDVGVTQMIRGKRTKLTTDQIEEGDPITVFGTYDQTLDLLQAKYIFIENNTETTRTAGTVTDVDSDANTVTVKTEAGRSVTADIERTTKTSSWDKKGGISKSGFSKITVGDTVHIVATPQKKDNRITAVRILDLGPLTGDAPTSTPTASPTAEATPKDDTTPTPTTEP